MVNRGVSFDPAKDIPLLKGKTVLITGSNFGIGRQTALDLAKHDPSELWIAARNASTGNDVVTEIQRVAPNVAAHFLEMDLASFDSVKAAARTFRATASRLDILILNAGIMGGPARLTKDGYKSRIGVNHMGHTLLFDLLVPLLQVAADERISVEPRIVNLSSAGHRNAPSGGIRFESLKTSGEHMSVIARYGQSKLANVLHAREIARRYLQFTAVSIYPGSINTGLFTDVGLVMRIIATIALPLVGVTVEEGAKTSLWAATAKDGVVSGEYYEPIGVTGKDSALSKDKDLAKKLWEWTEEELKDHMF